MLERTFQLIRGIGPSTEKKLWDAGVETWVDVFQKTRPKSVPVAIWDNLIIELQRYRDLFDMSDTSALIHMVPKYLHWQMIPNFLGQIAYLDIETTGLYPQSAYITTIAAYNGKKVYNFIRNDNLDEFPKFISRYPAIATYYGKCFDIPFIKHEMGIEFPQIHFDLCFLLRRLGLTGGLKSVEKQLGISRGELGGVDGYLAVLLWERYQRTGEKRFLDTLLAYNNEDVINLEFLLYHAYNNLIKKNRYPFDFLSLPEKSIERPYNADKKTIKEIVTINQPSKVERRDVKGKIGHKRINKKNARGISSFF